MNRIKTRKEFTKSYFIASMIILSFSLTNSLVAQTFTQVNTNMINVDQGEAAWGDYDNDGDLDVVIIGRDSAYNKIAKIYKNTNGTFLDINANLTAVSEGAVVWGDYDNDGDLDLLLTGFVTTSRISKIYNNNGGVFTDINANLIGVSYSTVDWGDYDADGDLDILLSGMTDFNYEPVTKIYRNDKNGVFTELTTYISQLSDGSAAWGDYDNDGDLDILLTGATLSYIKMSRIYRNNNGFFSLLNTSFDPVSSSSVAWGDYDNDGDLDIVIAGEASGRSTEIYRNNNGTFMNIYANLPGVDLSAVDWGDYDNDGDLDLLVSGSNQWIGGVLTGITKVFKNTNGIFSDINANLKGVNYSAASWGDYDNDGDLDILLVGDTTTIIYRNNTSTSNTAPLTPTGLTTSISGNSVTFKWNKSSDNQTVDSSLTYNLRIGTSTGSIDILSPMANLSNGYRRIVHIGNTGFDTGYTVKCLPAGTYYWNVQAIDNGYAGSTFATENSVTLSSSLPTVTITSHPATDTIAVGSPALFVVSVSGTDIIYQWQLSTNGGSFWTNIAGAIDDSLVLSSVNLGMELNQYRCIVNRPCYQGDTSNSAILRVVFVDPPTVYDNDRCGNGSVDLVALGTPSGGTYKWFTSPTIQTPISGAVDSVYSTPVLSQNDTFYVSIDSFGYLSTRVPVIATIIPLPTDIANIVYPSIICYADSAIIKIANSQIGVSYNLLNTVDSSNIGSTIAGNGDTIQFPTGILTDTTSFLIYAKDNSTLCERYFSSVPKINVVPLIILSLQDSIFACHVSDIEVFADPGFSSYAWNTGNNTRNLKVESTGTYSVKVTDNNGCLGFDTTYVNIINVNISQSDTTTCFGHGITLSVDSINNAYNYSWSTGDIATTIYVDSSKTAQYYLYVNHSSNTCIDSMIITVSHLKLNLTDSIILCNSDSVEIVADAGFVSYLWNSSETSQKISIKMSGIYTVTVTDTNGCKSMDSTYLNNITARILQDDTLTVCVGESVELYVDDQFHDYTYYWTSGDSTNPVILNPTVNITHIVTIFDRDINFCYDTITLDVVKNNLKLSGDNVCRVDSYALDGNAGYKNYLWNTGSNSRILYVLYSGTYTVTVTDYDGCKWTDSAYVDILNAEILEDDMTVTPDSSIRLNMISASPNYSIIFDGVDDYIEIQDDSSLNFGSSNSFTIECWFKTNESFANFTGLITKGTNEASIYELGIYNEQLGSEIGNPFSFPYNYFLSIKHIKNDWHHGAVVVNRNTKTASLYVDGILQNQITEEDIGDNYISSTATLKFAVNRTLTNYFKGNIDEVKIWNRALNKEEIQNRMFRHVTSSQENGLVGYWDFNEGVENTVYDQSGNLNNGVIHGANWSQDVPYEGILAINYKFLWSTGDTTRSIVVAPSNTTTYWVQIDNGVQICADSITITTKGVSIEEIINRNKIKVYPNPFNYQTNIRLPNDEGRAQRLELYDITGQLVKSWGDLQGNNLIISRGNLKSGIYLLRLVGEKIYYSKLIVE